MYSFIFFVKNKNSCLYCLATGDVSRVAAQVILRAAVMKAEELDVKMNIAVMDNGANLVGFLRLGLEI